MIPNGWLSAAGTRRGPASVRTLGELPSGIVLRSEPEMTTPDQDGWEQMISSAVPDEAVPVGVPSRVQNVPTNKSQLATSCLLMRAWGRSPS
jgi:hypothetical protein